MATWREIGNNAPGDTGPRLAHKLPEGEMSHVAEGPHHAKQGSSCPGIYGADGTRSVSQIAAEVDTSRISMYRII